MEPRGRERHRWAKPRGQNGREHMSQRGQRMSFNDAAGHFERVHVNADGVENGAEGFSDIEGKATRVGASERGQRMSFNDLADGPSRHEDDSSVNDSFQRRPMPLCPGERSGQPGKQRHIPDRVDRRPECREVLADFN
jgi:hypothetical protein